MTKEKARPISLVKSLEKSKRTDQFLLDIRGEGWNPSYLLKNTLTNSKVLAYLWIALESGVNVMIAGTEKSGRTPLLVSILPFIPRYERVAMIGEQAAELKFYQNILSVVSTPKTFFSSATDRLQSALRMKPNRIILDDMGTDSIRELFSATKVGISFVATIKSDQDTLPLIKGHLFGHVRVNNETLNSLDLVVAMKRNIPERIIECRWLSRAETLDVGIVIGDDSLKLLNTVENNTLNERLLLESKAINAYATDNGISIESAVKELENRSEFLNRKGSEYKSTPEMLKEIQKYKKAA